ncbi:MAG: hypothetical protein ACE5KH_06460, partial [Candidatus Geothermarchaeales archaeon]
METTRQKPYVDRVPRTWWLANRRYTAYMVRELTSVFISAFVLTYIYQISQLAAGREAYERFLAATNSPLVILANAVILVFALY